MRSRFHLFLCNETLDHVWCEDSPTGWVCPMVSAAWNVRGPSAVRWHLAQRRWPYRVRRIGYALAADGHAQVDWAAVLVVADSAMAGSSLALRALAELAHSTAALPAQAQLARELLADVEALRQDTRGDLVEWALAHLHVSAAAASTRQLRASACAEVIEIAARGARVFAKHAAGERFGEAELTMGLSRLGADVPKTIAYDPERRFWLTADVHGRLLETGGRTSDLDRVAEALAGQEQIRSRAVTSDIQAPGAALTRERVLRAVDGLCARGSASRVPHTMSLTARLERVLTGMPFDGPFAVLHTDPAPSNIVIDEKGPVTLIDWAEACWGPPALAIELFIQRLRQFTPKWLSKALINSERLRDIYRANGGTVLTLPLEERMCMRAVVRATLDFADATSRHERRELLSAYHVKCTELLKLVAAAVDVVSARAAV